MEVLLKSLSLILSLFGKSPAADEKVLKFLILYLQRISFCLKEIRMILLLMLFAQSVTVYMIMMTVLQQQLLVKNNQRIANILPVPTILMLVEGRNARLSC